MVQPHNILIHEFEADKQPVHLDDEGDQMIGFYYQFTDEANLPVSELVGPYKHSSAVERAARRAFKLRDF